MNYMDADWPAKPRMADLINQVHHCDASQLLAMIADKAAQAIITDMPYGLGTGKEFKSTGMPTGDYKAIREEWDSFVPVSWLDECQRPLVPGGSVVIFCGRLGAYKVANYCIDQLGWRLVNDITLFKHDAMPNMTGRFMTESTERLLWFCPDGTGWKYDLTFAKKVNGGYNLRDVWDHGQTRGLKIHPAQKTVQLMRRIIKLFTDKGDLVIDPFCGSATTAVAAESIDRNFICGDINQDYVEAARKRLAPLPLFKKAI